LSKQAELNLGAPYYYAGQYEKAADHYKKMLEKYPDDKSAIYSLGLVFLQLRAYSKVIEMFRPLHEKDKTFFAAPLGFAYANSGQPGQARKILAELEEISQVDKDKVPYQEKAIIYMALNDLNKAVALFRESCSERFATFPFIKVDPLFKDLRSDPRYPELLRCANLAP
jgi:tetratricopeptide (TPR) repeat protein